MEAKDLRLNSLVNYTTDGDTFLHTILAITETEGILLECNGIFEYVDTENIEPIPLTEEWLIKMGFITDKLNGFDHYKGDFEICLPNYFMWKDSLLNSIKHVHQLQNLYFALTSKELKIKL